MASVGIRLNMLSGILSLITLISPAELAAQKAPPQPSGLAREIALAREYVFAACLIRRYPNSEISKEADAWASGLVEHGRIRGEYYPKLAEIARNSAPAPLSSKLGMPMFLQSCLALYDSPTLPGMIRQILIGK
jgi:hypothetical protein